MVEHSLKLLGFLEVAWAVGTPPRFRSPRTKAILGYLVITSQAVSRDRLAVFFWPDKGLTEGRTALRRELHNLAKILPDCWEITAQSVRFTATPQTLVDLHQFRQFEQEKRWLNAAILIRGELLEGLYQEENLEFETWLMGERERFHQKAEHVLSKAAEFEQEQESYSNARRYLTLLLQLSPWHEGGHRRMMFLLARQGQFSSALKQYEKCRTILSEEIAVSPSLATVNLHERIKSAMTMPANNLPPQVTRFIGRTVELKMLRSRLTDPNCHLLTIIGIGGIGKTRLALRTAELLTSGPIRRFLHGGFFIPLAGITSANRFISILVSVLGIALKRKKPPEEQVLDFLEDKELLLLLDSYEYLLPDTRFLAAILRKAPMVKLLVTSREKLDLYGEWLFELDGLSYPRENELINSENQLPNYEAVQLFQECAVRVHSRFTHNANFLELIKISQLLYGIPLALELAASQLQRSKLKTIIEAIQQNLDTLNVSFPNIPERHRSLRATFDWSWNCLSLSEQEKLGNLVVFRGGFSDKAAIAVGNVSVEDLDILIGKSLLVASESGRGEMNDLIHQFVVEKAPKSAVMEARKHHLSYFLTLVEEAAQNLHGSNQASWLNQLEIEYLNIIAGLQFSMESGNWDSSSRIVGAMGGFWAIRGLLQEGSLWTNKLISAAEDQILPTNQADVLMASGWLAFEGGHYGQAIQMYEASLELWQNIGNKKQIADLLNRLGHAFQRNADYEIAIDYYQQSLNLHEEIGDEPGIALALNRLGHAIQLQGDDEQATALITASLSKRRELKDSRGIASCLNALGEIARVRGEFKTAELFYRDALELCMELGDSRCAAGLNHNLGHIMLHLGNHISAFAFFSEALSIYKGLDHKEGIALCLAGIAGVNTAQNKPEKATLLLSAAESYLTIASTDLALVDRQDWDRIQVSIKELIEDNNFSAAWSQGRKLPLARAIALATDKVT